MRRDPLGHGTARSTLRPLARAAFLHGPFGARAQPMDDTMSLPPHMAPARASAPEARRRLARLAVLLAAVSAAGCATSDTTVEVSGGVETVVEMRVH